jgi:Nucleoplasmin-like domain
MYTHDDNSYLLCTLQKGKMLQCPLDLNFMAGDNLCFSTKGNGIVHLTGFLVEDMDEFDDDMMDEEDMDEEM